MIYNSEDYPKVTAEALSKIPILILNLILIARDEDPEFWRYTSFQEVVNAMNSNANLKQRILKRLYYSETNPHLN